MDRRSVIKNAGIAGVLAAGVAPAVHAQPTIRWRLTSSFPKVLDTLFGVNDIFAAKVASMNRLTRLRSDRSRSLSYTTMSTRSEPLDVRIQGAEMLRL